MAKLKIADGLRSYALKQEGKGRLQKGEWQVGTEIVARLTLSFQKRGQERVPKKADRRSAAIQGA
jgi:hypothetical protein